jgi:hypothetical protein
MANEIEIVLAGKAAQTLDLSSFANSAIEMKAVSDTIFQVNLNEKGTASTIQPFIVDGKFVFIDAFVVDKRTTITFSTPTADDASETRIAITPNILVSQVDREERPKYWRYVVFLLILLLIFVCTSSCY